ncbi:MAG: Rieske 2Fe-2S domain-containing protein [Thaumarchaeota archaeon]|nr:Rieske 2Fe-2S domain-containing protein [Nitrososphaerota archaeon]
MKRRDFLKIATLGGIVTAVTPYVPYGSFLSQGAGATVAEKERVILPDGTTANIDRFPVNSKQIIVYPRTGDPVKDAEPFKRFQLIRLPSPEGDAEDASAFRAYSMICVHLWCLWDYKPERTQMECPCHGSIYRAIDGLAIDGPASAQTPPNNALARLDLEVDENGDIWVLPPDWSVDGNGIVGYGRKVS